MIRKGIKFKYAPHLTFRISPRDGDVDSRDRPVSQFYFVLIRKKDCLDENGNFVNRKRETAPQFVKLGYSATNMAYGKVRCQNRPRWFEDNDGNPVRVNRYWTRAVYYIKDGFVYQGTIRYQHEPDN